MADQSRRVVTYFPPTFLRAVLIRYGLVAIPLGHKPGLEPDQAQARPGPQLRVGLGFLQA